MKVLHLKTTDGRGLYTNVVPRDSAVDFKISAIKCIDMADEEYEKLPADKYGFRSDRRYSETPGSIEGFEAPNSRRN